MIDVNESTDVLTNEPCKKGVSKRHENGRSYLFGFGVDRLSLEEVVNCIDEAIVAKRPLHVILVNAGKIVLARKDPDLAYIIRTAELVGADGVPIIWASYLLSKPLPGRVNGTDLMNRLIELAAEKGYRVYFLGARQQVIEKAIVQLKQKYPSLQLAGYRNGYYNSPESERQVIDDVSGSRADILLIGMSSPKKEKWVRQHFQDLNVTVVHGVGGSFDILGGVTKRAPLWMQKAGLEWLYRLAQEPRRLWRRYLVGNAIYTFLVIRALTKRMINGRYK
jgi:N-acetylglucosaminyldiphosphoundecaprenol N-acetyl-beta-D-mannosaminyltransferase